MMAKVTMESLQNWFFWTWKVRSSDGISAGSDAFVRELKRLLF
jgi:hypothetical protein